jgi:hypothetical protein
MRQGLYVAMIVAIGVLLAATLYELGAHWGSYVGLAMLTFHAVNGASP